MSTGYTKPNKHELQNDLTAIAEIPERVTEFSKVRLKEILVYLNIELEYRMKIADAAASANFKKYKYPNEYLPNKELEYWLERTYQFGFNYYDLKHYQKFINNHLNSITIHDPVFNDAPSQRFFEYAVKHLYNINDLNNASISYVFHILKNDEDCIYIITGTRIDFADYYNKLAAKIDKKAFQVATSLNIASLTNFDQIGFKQKKQNLFNDMLLQFEKQ